MFLQTNFHYGASPINNCLGTLTLCYLDCNLCWRLKGFLNLQCWLWFNVTLVFSVLNNLNTFDCGPEQLHRNPWSWSCVVMWLIMQTWVLGTRADLDWTQGQSELAREQTNVWPRLRPCETLCYPRHLAMLKYYLMAVNDAFELGCVFSQPAVGPSPPLVAGAEGDLLRQQHHLGKGISPQGNVKKKMSLSVWLSVYDMGEETAIMRLLSGYKSIMHQPW